MDLGHLIPQVMRCYRMDYLGVMRLPMRVFWHLQGSMQRLYAEEQKDLLELLTTSQNPEASAELHAALAKQSPPPIKLSVRARIELTATRDEMGFDELRSMR